MALPGRIPQLSYISAPKIKVDFQWNYVPSNDHALIAIQPNQVKSPASQFFNLKYFSLYL